MAGACMVEGHGGQGVYMAEGMHGGGGMHGRGACVAGGMRGRGHAWRSCYMAGEMALQQTVRMLLECILVSIIFLRNEHVIVLPYHGTSDVSAPSDLEAKNPDMEG